MDHERKRKNHILLQSTGDGEWSAIFEMVDEIDVMNAKKYPMLKVLEQTNTQFPLAAGVYCETCRQIIIWLDTKHRAL